MVEVGRTDNHAQDKALGMPHGKNRSNRQPNVVQDGNEQILCDYFLPRLVYNGCHFRC